MRNRCVVLIAMSLSVVLGGQLAIAQVQPKPPVGAAPSGPRFLPPAGTPDSPQARQCVARAQQGLDNCFQAIAAARAAGRVPPDCSKIAPQTYNTCMDEAARAQQQSGKAIPGKPTLAPGR